MLILCFVLGMAILAVGVYFYMLDKAYFNYDTERELEKSNPKKYKRCEFFYNNEWAYRTPITSGIIMSVISLIATIILATGYSGIININDKISLYETENADIEQQISLVVENYQDWEADTYSQFKNESPTVLISLFPKLKSNELVKRQMEIYIENNQKIKKLKEEKLDYKIYAWWLYFGN